MVEYMLANIICHEFDKVVGKTQHETGKAMHVGFHLSVGATTDQYRVCHMYIFAPCNYVHVAVQTEVIDKRGEKHTEPMEHLCYHDSCWRDAVQNFIFKNRDKLSTLTSFNRLSDWYDVLTLTECEMNYLHMMDEARHTFGFGSDNEKKRLAEKMKVNPFDKRSLWKD